MNKKYLSIKEASEMLHVTKLTLRNWDNSGKLTASRHPINNYRVYLVEDIEKILEKINSKERNVVSKKIAQATELEKPKFYKLKVIHNQE